MDDHEKLKRQTSGELPARLSFNAEVTNLQEQLFDKAFSEFADQVGPDGQDLIDERKQYFLQRGNPVTFEEGPLDHSHNVSASILGSDEISIGEIFCDNPEDLDSPIRVIDLALFKNGSYLVVDDDPDRVSDDGVYAAISSVDGPPAIINVDYIREIRSFNPDGNMTFLEALMLIKSKTPERVHYLSDEECDELVEAIRKSEDLLEHDQIRE